MYRRLSDERPPDLSEVFVRLGRGYHQRTGVALYSGPSPGVGPPLGEWFFNPINLSLGEAAAGSDEWMPLAEREDGR